MLIFSPLTLQTPWVLLPTLHCAFLCCSRDSSQVKSSLPCPESCCWQRALSQVPDSCHTRSGQQRLRWAGGGRLWGEDAGTGVPWRWFPAVDAECGQRWVLAESRPGAMQGGAGLRDPGLRVRGRGCPWTLGSLGPAPSLISRGRSRSLAATGDGCPPRGGGREGSAAGPAGAGTGTGTGSGAGLEPEPGGGMGQRRGPAVLLLALGEGMRASGRGDRAVSGGRGDAMRVPFFPPSLPSSGRGLRGSPRRSLSPGRGCRCRDGSPG